MSFGTNRRRFLQTTAATGIGFWVAGGVQAQESKSPNERIAIACIGLGGKGSEDSNDAGRHGDVVAICDTNENLLGNTGSKRFPKAKRYTDYRKMLEEMEKSINAVTISTPDHNHAPAALLAMRLGKHCFCQKPLAHTIYEARLLAKVANEKNVATQMGNQGTSYGSLRHAAAIVQAGAVGTVQEVHVWTNRPKWSQGVPRPKPQPVPAHLQWNLWLGPAPARPYANGYDPTAWRGWWDFGTGALGDMACHTVNMPYMALNLRDPVSIQAETSGHNKDSYPKWSTIVFDYPALDGRAALKLFWYDGGKIPDNELLAEMKTLYSDALERDRRFLSSGCLVKGEKGTLYAPGDYCEIPIKFSKGLTVPIVKYENSPGHFAEWIRAIKTIGAADYQPAVSNFSAYAGRLTETILLGNLAVWVADKGKGEKVEWDAKTMTSPNTKGLESMIKPTYRPGYTLDV
jgi:predicted dehydrogenase